MGSRYELFKIAEELKEIVEKTDVGPDLAIAEEFDEVKEENEALKKELDKLKQSVSEIKDEVADNNTEDKIEKKSSWELDDFSIGRSSQGGVSRSEDPLFEYLLSKQKK